MDHHHFGKITKLTPKKYLFIKFNFFSIINNKKTRASSIWPHMKERVQERQEPEEPEPEPEQEPQEAAAEPEQEPQGAAAEPEQEPGEEQGPLT
jgi:hypothetical protein